jgi:protein HOOK3
MGSSEALSKALIEWVNTFDLPKHVGGWKELLDGVIIWRILNDIDPDYFHGPLPEAEAGETNNWIPKWTNRMSDTLITTGYRQTNSCIIQ